MTQRRQYRRSACRAEVPASLIHWNPDLADDMGDSQVSLSQYQSSYCYHATCHYVIASQSQNTSVTSIAFLSHISCCSYSPHCASVLPYHSITMSHGPCISATISHLTMPRVIIASHKFSRSSKLLQNYFRRCHPLPITHSRPSHREECSPDMGIGQVFTLAIGTLGLFL